jgi:hypothetical protein
MLKAICHQHNHEESSEYNDRGKCCITSNCLLDDYLIARSAFACSKRKQYRNLADPNSMS